MKAARGDIEREDVNTGTMTTAISMVMEGTTASIKVKNRRGGGCVNWSTRPTFRYVNDTKVHV